MKNAETMKKRFVEDGFYTDLEKRKRDRVYTKKVTAVFEGHIIALSCINSRSWFNMTEIELDTLTGQGVKRRSADI